MADAAHAFSPILYFSPEMVVELALGAEHPHEVAERYGYDPTQYETLAAQPWFADLVVKKRTELHEDGVLFVAKAGMMAEALLTRLFQQALAGTLTQPLMVEVAKQLSDIGRLKPAAAAQAAASAVPFQINIQVNGAEVLHGHTPPADLVAVPEVAPTMVLDFAASLPDPPPSLAQALRVPDFDLRPSALVGNPTAVQAALAASPPARSDTHAAAGTFGPGQAVSTRPAP
jgi:hypothetical protein